MHKLLAQFPEITDLLGKYLLPDGTPGTIPLIKGGVLPETETDLPCIVYNVEPGKRIKAHKYQYFLLKCCAGDTINMKDSEAKSYELAETVESKLNGFHGFAGTTPVSASVSILGQQVDPDSRQSITPIEVRLNILGGA